MKSSFILHTPDHQQIHCHCWRVAAPRAVVQIAHGGAEHGGRYARLAELLNQHGMTVYAQDHRGHGLTGQLNGKLGYLGEENAFDHICADEQLLTAHAKAQDPGVPVVLMGHSLGSLITQKILLDASDDYAAAVLSGSPDIESVAAARELVDAEVARLGREAVSEALETGIVEGFNAAFPDARTPYDWLSRDPDEVDDYARDPWCGFALCASAWQDLIECMLPTADASRVAEMRKNLPIYIFSGTDDPVHGQWAAIDRLVANYHAAGMRDISVQAYPGGRHEMLNETNRDEVMRDLVTWLAQKL